MLVQTGELGQLDGETLSALHKLQPINGKEQLGRSLFYFHCLHLYCQRQIDLLINRAATGEFGDYLKQLAECGISDWDTGSAVKLLAVINVHMVGLQTCSDDGPGWLAEFLFEALRESDEVFPEPPVSSILETHGSWTEEKMSREIAVHACHRLGFPAESEDAIIVLQQFLFDAAPLRTELLLFALSQPFDALRLHLQELQR